MHMSHRINKLKLKLEKKHENKNKIKRKLQNCIKKNKDQSKILTKIKQYRDIMKAVVFIPAMKQARQFIPRLFSRSLNAEEIAHYD